MKKLYFKVGNTLTWLILFVALVYMGIGYFIYSTLAKADPGCSLDCENTPGSYQDSSKESNFPFKKYIVDNKNYTQVTYGSFIDVKLRHLDLDTTYMDASFRNIPMATIDKTANVKLNDWDEFLKKCKITF